MSGFITQLNFWLTNQNPTQLTTYYWNKESGEQRDKPWEHTHVVSGPLQNGWWRVSVEQAGRYTFRLRRWPKESGLASTNTRIT